MLLEAGDEWIEALMGVLELRQREKEKRQRREAARSRRVR